MEQGRSGDEEEARSWVGSEAECEIHFSSSSLVCLGRLGLSAEEHGCLSLSRLTFSYLKSVSCRGVLQCKSHKKQPNKDVGQQTSE